jgi:hypothetical protein
MIAIITALAGAMREHGDVVLVVIVATLMLGFLLFMGDRMMARRFRIHEEVEQRANAALAMTAESAAGTALVAGRHIEELRAETTALRLDVNNLGELLRSHELRIADAEAKLARGAFVMPRRDP